MNKIPLLAAAVALATTLATAPAQASDVQVRGSIFIGLPVPLPVPVWPRVEIVSPPVHAEPAWRGHDRDRDGVPDWRDRYDNRRDGYRRPGWRVDRDRDGVPDWRDPYDNRRDRFEQHRDRAYRGGHHH